MVYLGVVVYKVEIKNNNKMGLFSRKKKNDNVSYLNLLLEFELKDGEFILPKKLWNCVTSYYLNTEKNLLILKGGKYFEIDDISILFNEMFNNLGIDSNGDEGWSDEETQNVNNFGDVSRDWYLDENLNTKPAKWVTEDDNISKISKQILLSCDTKDEGIEIMFTGWDEIKEFIKKTS